MKKLSSKILSLVLSLVIILALVPAVPAKAADSADSEPEYVNATQSFTLYKKGCYANIFIWNLKPNQKVTAIKSSKKSVASVVGIYRTDSSNTYKNYSKEVTYENNASADVRIKIKLQKAGKTTVSFKVDGKKYKTTVTVNKYVNPVKTVKITGVAGGKNLASKTGKMNFYNTKSVKKKGAKITVVPKKGWTVDNVKLENTTTGFYFNQGKYEKYNPEKDRIDLYPVKTVSLGNFDKKCCYTIEIELINDKDGHSERLYYSLGKNYYFFDNYNAVLMYNE